MRQGRRQAEDHPQVQRHPHLLRRGPEAGRQPQAGQVAPRGLYHLSEVQRDLRQRRLQRFRQPGGDRRGQQEAERRHQGGVRPVKRQLHQRILEQLPVRCLSSPMPKNYFQQKRIFV